MSYAASRALFARAARVIPGGVPGHLGPVDGCFIPVSAYPFFVERAAGAYLWDVDGNRFIDYLGGYGPMVLGYAHPAVEEAVRRQEASVDTATLPSARMVDLAELLVETVTSADWATFAKNGNDVTTQALMVARAATGRRKAVFVKGGYHGWQPWTQRLGSPGVTAADVADNLYVRWNHLEDLEEALALFPDDIACVMATPYHHPAFEDQVLPLPDYWPRLREICTNHGIVLIVDDVRCGFRLDVAGSDAHYGFQADLLCLGKALTNGRPLAALCGAEALRDAASSVFATGSYWLSAAPMAAAIATVTTLRDLDAPRLLRERGLRLTEGLRAAGAEHGIDLRISGEPAMWFMRVAADDDLVMHQEWVAQCVRRGVFFAGHHNHFLNTALDDDDLARTIEVAHEAFAVVARAHPAEVES